MVVKDVNYAHGLESVLIPETDGTVNDVRYGIRFNIMPFQLEEFQDTSAIIVDEIRMIRNREGYYFITANKFKHVYVMVPKEGSLKLKKKILVDENGINSPAFNWRDPVVELINRDTKEVISLNSKGTLKAEDKS